jgi:hypothetical protein
VRRALLLAGRASLHSFSGNIEDLRARLLGFQLYPSMFILLSALGHYHFWARYLFASASSGRSVSA